MSLKKSFDKPIARNSTYPKHQSDGGLISTEGYEDAVLCTQEVINWSDVGGWVGGRREMQLLSN